MIYLIGSLRNPRVPLIAAELREAGFLVFDDWYAAGPNADDHWRDYEQARGHTFVQALRGASAKNVYDFDRRNILAADQVVLVCPAGKSGHLELGWALGQGKPGFILLDGADPERFDVMLQFATGVCENMDQLIAALQKV